MTNSWTTYDTFHRTYDYMLDYISLQIRQHITVPELHAIHVLNNHLVAYEDNWTTHEMR